VTSLVCVVKLFFYHNDDDDRPEHLLFFLLKEKNNCGGGTKFEEAIPHFIYPTQKASTKLGSLIHISSSSQVNK
jgi:hypothetical protein